MNQLNVSNIRSVRFNVHARSVTVSTGMSRLPKVTVRTNRTDRQTDRRDRTYYYAAFATDSKFSASRSEQSTTISTNEALHKLMFYIILFCIYNSADLTRITASRGQNSYYCRTACNNLRCITTNPNHIPNPTYPTNPRTNLNPLKCSGIRWLHFEVFSAIQV